MGRKLYLECFGTDLNGLYLQILLDIADVADDVTRRVHIEHENLMILSRKYGQPPAKIWEVISNLSKTGFLLRIGNNRWSVSKPPLDGIEKIHDHISSGKRDRQYVYVIEAKGKYKIGVTCDIKARLCTIQVSSPKKPELICYFETNDAYQLEKELHQRFKSKRVHGEWFELNVDDLNNLTGGKYTILL